MYKIICKKTNRQIFYPLMACFLLSILLTCNPAFAKQPVSEKSANAVKKSTVSPAQMTVAGNYLFRFRIPVNITLAGDLEKYTKSSEIMVSCSVYPGNDSNFSNAGGRGSKIINLTNHSYNGTVTIDITSMEGNSLPHQMTKWRCLILSKDPAHGPNSWSAPVLNQFAQPGSKTSFTGNL
jgi:hypothetical protein